MRIHILSIVLSVIVFAVLPLRAQQQNENPFANGEPIGVVFSNFYTGVNQGDNPSAFEVRRAYLGYKFDIHEHYSAKIELDIGSPDDVSQYSLLRRFAYFKEANLQYTRGRFTAKFGIIPLQQFKLQEKIWGHRYVYESVLDQHSLGSSADLGASLNYRATNFLEIDFTLMNGEGYSRLQADYSYKAGIGATLKPWKGMIMRGYVDAIQKNVMMFTIVGFIAYRIPDRLTCGVEYDVKKNEDFENGRNINVFSGYLSYDISPKFQVFGRYDIIRSNKPAGEPNPWNLAEDGSAIIAGVQYIPVQKVKLAVNYQDWVPYAKNLDTEAYLYLNLEFRLW